MTKKGMHNFFVYSVLILSLLLFFGCGVSENETANITSDEEEPDAREITIGEPKERESFIYEGIIKVDDTYKEYEKEVPLKVISEKLKKDSYERTVLLSHDVKAEDGKVKDFVSYKTDIVNPTGMVAQTIKFDAVFEEEGGEWKLVSNEWSEWTVKNKRISGSGWHKKIDASRDISDWFEGVSKEDTGELYVCFKKNMNILSAFKDEENPFEAKIGTNCSGDLYFVSGDSVKEVSFKCTEGKTDDEGNFSLKLVTENGEDYMDFANGYEYISNLSAKKILEGDSDLSDALSIDEIDTFEVSSESLVFGEWKKECGTKNGNLSPGLSWEEVEGAAQYAIIMIDLDEQNNHLHWFETVEGTRVEEGAYDKTSGYDGPFPESPHDYNIYVFALREETDDLGLIPGGQGLEVQKFIDLLEKEKPGNIISYGMIQGSYEYYEVW